jgi:hypothetical protein
MKPNQQPLPRQNGPRPFAQQQPTPNGLMTCPAIETYHEARETLNEFCARTDADRKRFNDAHNEARSQVFSFVNENMIHEATVFEVLIPAQVDLDHPENDKPEESVFYLVEPRNTEIKRVDFVQQQQQAQQ